VHVNGSGGAKKRGLAAGLLFGTAVESAGTGRALSHARGLVSDPAVPRMPNFAGVRTASPRGKLKLIAAGVTHSKLGAVGEVGLQAANLGIGLAAARELVRKPGHGSVSKARLGRGSLRRVAEVGGVGLTGAAGYRVASHAARQRAPRVPPAGVVRKADGPAEVTFRAEISKVDTEKRQVFGWCSLSTKDGAPVIDLQGDYVPIEEIEKSAYHYVVNSRKGGDMHRRVKKGLTTDYDEPLHTADLVESFVVTPEKLERMGLPEDALPLGWWVGFKVNDDEQWELVKSGKRTGFSIHGSGTRKDLH